ncbi:late competence development protein ComFB [Thermacetogenium phaeum DSM 12270]|jgi:competence protein ComFB|uniref:Late competence development protein ComFB n=1 Tax=Thermacetogenium phaeum (strain ATCC BAA-254 / DSM 26808 / PB) TaxID=1089553 RepID=K4LEW8_THEPS|nr:late competence development ComFB family protein [Thermacetogenium phaeum]AFV11581.1 late competence development protein ComFB [Thermacetogenium phaeum DSM 12270]
MLRLVNVMEILVEETIEDIMKSHPDFCTCERCRYDVAAIALNKLPPSYVVTMEGEAILRANSLKQQVRVDLIRAVTEAMIIVGKNPHHAENRG